MSVDQTEIIEGIRQKIQSVKSRLQVQQEENDELKKKYEELQTLMLQQQSVIDELEQKNQKLALVKGIMANGEDNQDAKIQIKRIVREIDKCIALLNK